MPAKWSTFCVSIYCVEVLFFQICENNNIHGIKIGDHEINLSAYADDADFLTSDVSSLCKIFSICATFQSYLQGCSKKSVDCKGIDIKTGAIRASGVFNSYHTDLVEKLNFLDNLKALADVAICGNTADFISQEIF